jgi:hypothetical protein
MPRDPLLMLRKGDRRGVSTDEPPDFTLTVQLRGSPYLVAIEICLSGDEATPFASGTSIRRSDRGRVSARDVQRLPLSAMMRAATAAVGAAVREGAGWSAEVPPFKIGDGDRWPHKARKVLVPRGRPQRGKSTEFYREIARTHDEYSALGLSPAKEIASKKNVPEGTVHQWFHRARNLGFLARSPRSVTRD